MCEEVKLLPSQLDTTNMFCPLRVQRNFLILSNQLAHIVKSHLQKFGRLFQQLHYLRDA